MEDYYKSETTCRLTGEDLDNAEVLVKFENLPIPGLFFASKEKSLDKRIPMTIVKSQKGGFIQNIETINGDLYKWDRSGQSDIFHYDWLENISNQLTSSFTYDSRILEVGGGKGHLLNQLKKSGFSELYNVDPSNDNIEQPNFKSIIGLFPEALDEKKYKEYFDCIIGQHFLEHTPNPINVLKKGYELLKEEGEIWIEVPNMDIGENDCFVQASFFYSLHLNSFTRRTLQEAGELSGFKLASMVLVNHYGKSLWAKFKKTKKSLPIHKFVDSIDLNAQIQNYFQILKQFSKELPKEILVWGAAEKPHTMLAILAESGIKPIRIFDSNIDIQGLYLSGFDIKIESPDNFPKNPDQVLILSPFKHKEIISLIRNRLSQKTIIHVPFVGHLTLADYG